MACLHDGKTLRRSFDAAAKRSPLHVVTAFATDARMATGQVTAGDKQSQIVAARSLLSLLVTGLAVHCRGKTARLIEERGGGLGKAPMGSRPSAW